LNIRHKSEEVKLDATEEISIIRIDLSVAINVKGIDLIREKLNLVGLDQKVTQEAHILEVKDAVPVGVSSFTRLSALSARRRAASGTGCALQACKNRCT
jgi:hypothetical protein